jgi:UDP-N-acetylmuramate: L-alanyl-gamma-D-glutamyl-meso-diaminopimelate ligase
MVGVFKEDIVKVGCVGESDVNDVPSRQDSFKRLRMRIHFTGIAGAGMSAAALMMRGAGHEVSGSDEDVFPPMSTYVEGLGFPFHRRFDAANLPAELDILVLGASAKLGGDSNPEVIEARRRGVTVTTFPELVGEATQGRANTVVAGSFGKSTCTALLAHVLREAGHDPGWMIGAISPALPDTGHWGSAREVVLEGDEYIVGEHDRRSKFVLYHPRDVLLTSLVHDHINVFPTFADYEAPFQDLLGLLPQDGLLVAREHPAIRAIAGRTGARTVWYDTAPCDGWWSDGAVFGETSTFVLHSPDDRRIPLATGLLGEHNIENIVGVSAYVLERGLADEATLTRAIASFAGIRRRLDRLTKASRVPVIEGFGSSYEKARSAIEAMLLHYPHRPLTVVFEPHTFSWRSRDALNWYDTVFEGVARVLLIPPPSHGAASHHQASFEDILARIASAGVPVDGVQTADEATAALSNLSGEEVVLLLSSGPLLGLPDGLPPVFDRLYG